MGEKDGRRQIIGPTVRTNEVNTGSKISRQSNAR